MTLIPHNSVIRNSVIPGTQYLITLNGGWTFYWFKMYRSGKASIGKMAEELGYSMSEAIDMLAGFGIESPLRYDDYLQGFQNLKEPEGMLKR